MLLEFNNNEIESIGEVLGVQPKLVGSCYRYELENIEHGRRLSLEIYPKLKIGKKIGHLVSVYTPTAHLQLHFCTGFIASKLLGEVTFVGESEGRLSGIIVEKEGGCSLYANLEKKLLSGDFTTLGPEVMLSGIALSLTENIIPVNAKETESNSISKKAKRKKNVPSARTSRVRKKRAKKLR